MADGTPAGSFVNLPQAIENTSLTVIVGSCQGSATHMHPANTIQGSRETFPAFIINWMSPPAGTGPIRFRSVLAISNLFHSQVSQWHGICCYIRTQLCMIVLQSYRAVF